MTWVKLDDNFTDHPKIVGLSDRAFRVHVRALCYCGRFSPGVGSIPNNALKSLSATAGIITELVAAKLWDESGEGFYVHDFAMYHPKPDREAKQAAGRQGGIASGQARRSKAEAETKQSASYLVEQKRTPVPDPYPTLSFSKEKLSRPTSRLNVPEGETPLPLPRKTVVTEEWVMEEREFFKGKLPPSGFGSFDKVMRERMNGTYFKNAPDKRAYLHGQWENAAERCRGANGNYVAQTFKAEGIFE